MTFLSDPAGSQWSSYLEHVWRSEVRPPKRPFLCWSREFICALRPVTDMVKLFKFSLNCVDVFCRSRLKFSEEHLMMIFLLCATCMFGQQLFKECNRCNFTQWRKQRMLLFWRIITLTLSIHFSGHERQSQFSSSQISCCRCFLVGFHLSSISCCDKHCVCESGEESRTAPRAFWPRTDYLPMLTSRPASRYQRIQCWLKCAAKYLCWLEYYSIFNIQLKSGYLMKDPLEKH